MSTHKIIKYNFKNWYHGFEASAFHDFITKLFGNDSDFIFELSEHPDFIIYGVYGDYISSACEDPFSIVKILYITEPTYPDFSFFDYCIGFEPFSFGRRYCFFNPIFSGLPDKHKKLSKIEAIDIVRSKTYFCDFIFNHDGYDVSRKHYLDLLTSYKRVECAGIYLNNQKDGMTVSYNNNTKFNFEKKCKFSICIQSTDIDWFINEKLTQSFEANTIPIFYGPDSVKNIFNPKRFLFIKDFKTDQELLDKIVEIDNNDDLCASILMEPILTNDNFKLDCLNNLKKFLNNIFSTENPKILRNQFVLGETLTMFKNNKRRIRKFNKLTKWLHPFK